MKDSGVLVTSKDRIKILNIRKWWRKQVKSGNPYNAIARAKEEVKGAEIENTGGGCMCALFEIREGLIVSWNDESFGITIAKEKGVTGWDLFYLMGDEEKTYGSNEWASEPSRPCVI